LQAHFLALTGGTLTGPLILPADPTLAQQAATKHYVDSVQGAGLPITGGTMQGPINMSGAKILNLADPGSPQDAATKNYVDTVDALLAPKASPTFTGTPAAPTATSGNNSTQLATTAYVDGAVGGIGGAWGAGDVKLTFKNVADPGWLMMDDLLIGKTASTADHKNDLYTNLFQLLYNNIPDTWCPVFATKGGAGNVRTGNALNDFNAGFVLTLPRTLGRALAIAGTGAGLTGRALGQFLGEETHVLTAPESVPHRHIVVVQVPDVAISDAQVQPVPNGPTNGLAEGDFTGASLARSGVWAANSFGTTGPRLYDAASTADRTGNGLTLNDSVYLGNAGGTPPGSDVARGHNNMSPESFLNVMIKY
jgi:hypothetical protein